MKKCAKLRLTVPSLLLSGEFFLPCVAASASRLTLILFAFGMGDAARYSRYALELQECRENTNGRAYLYPSCRLYNRRQSRARLSQVAAAAELRSASGRERRERADEGETRKRCGIC